MKTLLTLLLLATGLHTFSQSALLRGRVKDSTKYGIIQDAQLHFLKNDTTINSGSGGNYSIELHKHLTDTIVISHFKYGTTKVAVSLEDKTVKELDIHFPVSCKSFPKKDVCPKCNTNKSVLAIVYGYPTEKTFERAENGEIKLGGCVINDCMPHYHCKKDQLDF